MKIFDLLIKFYLFENYRTKSTKQKRHILTVNIYTLIQFNENKKRFLDDPKVFELMFMQLAWLVLSLQLSWQ